MIWACCLSQVHDRVFYHSRYKRPSRTLSIAQVSRCATAVSLCQNQHQTLCELFLYLSEVSFSCETRASALHKQVELLKPILNITEAVIAEVCFMVCLCMKRISLTGAVHCHIIMPYRTLVGLRKELFQDPRADGRHSCRAMTFYIEVAYNQPLLWLLNCSSYMYLSLGPCSVIPLKFAKSAHLHYFNPLNHR